MGAPLINATLWPGSVLYVPRGHYHHTATDAGSLAAPDVFADASLDATDAAGARTDGRAKAADVEGQPSMALTFSVLSEDVLVSWLHLLGEACDELARQQDWTASATAEEARRMSRALRRRARGAPADADDGGARLRESLPRALLAPCDRSPRAMFANADSKWDQWRQHARALLAEAWAAFDGTRGGTSPPGWADALDAGTPLAQALDGVLVRKRAPCHNKLDQARPPAQIPTQSQSYTGLPDLDPRRPSYRELHTRLQMNAFLDAVAGRALDGQPKPDIDIDTIFRIEKRDKSHLPTERIWFSPRDW